MELPGWHVSYLEEALLWHWGRQVNSRAGHGWACVIQTIQLAQIYLSKENFFMKKLPSMASKCPSHMERFWKEGGEGQASSILGLFPTKRKKKEEYRMTRKGSLFLSGGSGGRHRLKALVSVLRPLPTVPIPLEAGRLGHSAWKKPKGRQSLFSVGD